MAGTAAVSPSCIFCQIARSSTTTSLLHTDEKVVAFQDINPSASRHYLVIPVDHIATVKDLRRRTEDYSLVSHMLNVGQTLLSRDAPNSIQYRSLDNHNTLMQLMLTVRMPISYIFFRLKVDRFGFHQPPLNSVNHLHLHCLALPYVPRWRRVKYSSLGPLGGFIEARKVLERLKP